MFGIVIYNFDIAKSSELVLAVKWGFLLIFFQEIVAHIFNTLGWKYAIDSELNIKIKFGKLLLMRIAGDAINYVTPSATLAGELAKAHMMGNKHSISHRLSTVALAKITQTAAMTIISIIALIWLFSGEWNVKMLGQQMKIAAFLIFAIILFILFLELRAAKTKEETNNFAEKPKTFREKLRELDRVTMLFIKKKPIQCLLSTFFFSLAYLWGAVEAYLILYFLNIKISLSMALLIEMLSVFLDGIFFAVPLKAGTQEATKIAIFSALKYNTHIGLSFGIIRHIREILWALLGMGMFYKINWRS